MEREIWCRDSPRDAWESWAIRIGTKAEIRASALGLLRSMIEGGLHKPAVRIGDTGRAFTARVLYEEGGEN